ncbi:MAG: FIST C-terminal domain-containing protein [Myxococcales bacterium]|nr:FIST C-terminal domain-containing protein [Myxococcales bacterium]
MIHSNVGQHLRAGVALHGDKDPARAARCALAEAAVSIGRDNVQTVVVLASGIHGAKATDIAAACREITPAATVIVAGGTDVMGPDAETSGEAALGVLALATPVTVATGDAGGEPRRLGLRLGEGLRAEPSTPYLLFCRSYLFDEELVVGFGEGTGSPFLMGGGITEGSTLAIMRPGEDPTAAAAIAVRFDGGVRMAIGVTPGVEYLTEFATVRRVEEGFVTDLGGERPLDMLSRAVRDRERRPLVLAAMAPRGEGHGRSDISLVRGVTGVHPPKGGVHLGDHVREGDRVAFVTPDAHAAMEDFRVMLRSLERNLGGGVPLAGLYVGCASRGSRLFASPGADARTIRAGLGEIPYAGMYSSFEIAPFDGWPTMHVYSGVLGILYNAS